MKKDCPFCLILQNAKSIKKIYEDDDCVALLDIKPATPGHILLVTKEHYEMISDIPPDTCASLFIKARDISKEMLGKLGCKGTNVFIANGESAGQHVPHFMMHIIPRYENDGKNLFQLQKDRYDDEESYTILKAFFRRIDSFKHITTPKESIKILEQENPPDNFLYAEEADDG